LSGNQDVTQMRIFPHPGMVLAVHTGGMFAEGIRIGSVLLDETAAQNHILGITHQDQKTLRWWGIEGRPGGVGWVDATPYLSSPVTVSNQRQPLDTRQQAGIVAALKLALGTPYDWEVIAEEAERDLHLKSTWSNTSAWGDTVPAHVICSSLLVWGYKRNGADYPKNTDPGHEQPADWVQFINENNYA